MKGQTVKTFSSILLHNFSRGSSVSLQRTPAPEILEFWLSLFQIHTQPRVGPGTSLHLFNDSSYMKWSYEHEFVMILKKVKDESAVKFVE